MVGWRSYPRKRGGKPCIRGLRITVYDVLEYLASGMSEDEILADFPDLERGRHPSVPGVRRRPRAPIGVAASWMRLLFDQSLSPRLKETLRYLYPESVHVET